jgi:Bacteriophage translational regulator
MSDDIFQGVGVEVTLTKPDDFLKCRETLTRIGVASKSSNTLFQSCHILHKRGEYAIVHFKEMFKLDGKSTDLTDNDLARRNTIVKLLEEWKLVNIKDKTKADVPPPAPLSQIKIIAHKDKKNWQLVAKYSIGKKKQD